MPTAFSWAKFERVAKYKAPFAKLRIAQRVSDLEADAIADALVGPVLSGPVQTAFGDALDRVRHGMTARDAVECIAVHYGLDEVAVENLVDDVEQDVASNGVRW